MNRVSRFKFSKLLPGVLLLALFGCSEPPQPEPIVKKVKAIQVGGSSGLEQRAFPGKAQAQAEATMSFRVSGQMATLDVKPGDAVVKDQLLASLDDIDYKNRVRVAEARVAEAEAAYLDASKNYRRLLDIQKTDPDIVSQAMIDNAQANDAITNAARSSAKAALRLAQDQMSYAHLEAPFDGEVVATYVEAFETVVAKQKILRLINRSIMEFVIDIPEGLIGFTNLVEQVDVAFDVKPGVKLSATVKEIGREASAGTRTYPVTLLIEVPDSFDVLPGMAGKAYIKATLPEESGMSGIEIPASALFSEGELASSYVWVVVDNQVTKRSVTVSRTTDFGIQLKEGLNPGEWLVVAGVHSIVEGQQVRVLDAGAAKE